MGFGDSNISTSGGSNSIMVHKKKAPKHGKELGLKKGQFRAKNLPKELQATHLINVKTGAITKRRVAKTGVDDPLATVSKQVSVRDGKNIVREAPTQTERPKGDINLTPEVGRQESGEIVLNRPVEERTVGQDVTSVLKAAGVGAAIGTGAFLLGGAILGGATTTAVSKVIQSGFAQQTAATGASFTATAPRAATQAIHKVGSMVINSKTIGLAKNLMRKFFTKTITSTNLGTGVTTVTRVASRGAYVATAIAWASSVFLGRWGQSEAPEAILFPIKELIKQAKTPEDWAEIDEHLKIAEEISDVTIWEEIILWSPFAAVEGTISKARGVAEGVKILRETAENVLEEQAREEAQGGSDFDVAQRERDTARDKRDADFKQSEEDRIERQDERDREFSESEKARNIRQDERDLAFEESQAERDRKGKERDEKFAADQEERDVAKERETRILQEVFRLRRIKKYDEADALELTIFE